MNSISNGIALRDFQETVKQKLRETIGEMMPTEVLQKLIEETVREVYLSPIIKQESYGNTRVEPSVVIQLIDKSIRAMVEVEVQKWFSENHQAMVQIVSDMIKAGIVTAITSSLEHRVRGATTAILKAVIKQVFPNANVDHIY